MNILASVVLIVFLHFRYLNSHWLTLKAYSSSIILWQNMFKATIWWLKCAFVLTYVGSKIDRRYENHDRIFLYAINGQLCHKSGPLEVTPSRHTSYVHLYIIDDKTATREQILNSYMLNASIVQRITCMPYICKNFFIVQFCSASECLWQNVWTDPNLITTKELSRLLTKLITGQNTRTKIVSTAFEIWVIIIDTAYSSNFEDIMLRLWAL